MNSHLLPVANPQNPHHHFWHSMSLPRCPQLSPHCQHRCNTMLLHMSHGQHPDEHLRHCKVLSIDHSAHMHTVSTRTPTCTQIKTSNYWKVLQCRRHTIKLFILGCKRCKRNPSYPDKISLYINILYNGTSDGNASHVHEACTVT